MATMNSLVLGNVSQNLSTPCVLKVVAAQEFIRDEVLVSPSIDPYLIIAHANQLWRSGKSLALDTTPQRALHTLQR